MLSKSKSKKKKIKEWLPAILIMTVCILSISTPAFASGGGFDWEDKLQAVADSLTGPVAVTISVITVVGSAIMLSWGEHGSVMRMLLRTVIGLTLALNGASFVAKFGSGSGGLI